ncbi:unnamed protein product, partial [Symbiodinium microadriaticum]
AEPVVADAASLAAPVATERVAAAVVPAAGLAEETLDPVSVARYDKFWSKYIVKAGDIWKNVDGPEDEDSKAKLRSLGLWRPNLAVEPPSLGVQGDDAQCLARSHQRDLKQRKSDACAKGKAAPKLPDCPDDEMVPAVSTAALAKPKAKSKSKAKGKAKAASKRKAADMEGSDEDPVIDEKEKGTRVPAPSSEKEPVEGTIVPLSCPEKQEDGEQVSKKALRDSFYAIIRPRLVASSLHEDPYWKKAKAALDVLKPELKDLMKAAGEQAHAYLMEIKHTSSSNAGDGRVELACHVALRGSGDVVAPHHGVLVAIQSLCEMSWHRAQHDRLLRLEKERSCSFECSHIPWKKNDQDLATTAPQGGLLVSVADAVGLGHRITYFQTTQDRRNDDLELGLQRLGAGTLALSQAQDEEIARLSSELESAVGRLHRLEQAVAIMFGCLVLQLMRLAAK